MGAITFASEDLAVRDQLNDRLMATTNSSRDTAGSSERKGESGTKKENNDAEVHRLSISEIDKRHIKCPLAVLSFDPGFLGVCQQLVDYSVLHMSYIDGMHVDSWFSYGYAP